MAAGAAETLKRTPLYDRHVAAGARLVPFAGWEMPVQYAGIREEHIAVRRASGVFDVSHMGEIETTGPDAERFLQRVLSNDVTKIAEDGAQYSRALPRGRRRARRPLHLPPRRTTLPDRHQRRQPRARPGVDARHAEGYDVEVDDRLDDYAMLAVQGPRRARRRRRAGRRRRCPTRFRTAELTVAGAPVLVCGTGYTGEDGVELLIAPEHAAAVWDALSSAGATPAGLGARDTLRLEVCFHLYGNDLIGGAQPDRGRPRLVLQGGHGLHRGRGGPRRPRGRARREAGPVRHDRARDPRQGNPVAGGGEVTWGTMSPCLGIGIGMAYVPADRDRARTEIEIDVRGKPRAGRGAGEAALRKGATVVAAATPTTSVSPRARLGADRRRRRHVRHHLVRPGPARRGGLRRPAGGRQAGRPRTSPTRRSNR